MCSFEGTIYGPVAKLVIAPPCHGGDQGFEPPLGRFQLVMRQLENVRYGIIAQLGEHMPYKHGVIGSSPIGPSWVL